MNTNLLHGLRGPAYLQVIIPPRWIYDSIKPPTRANRFGCPLTFSTKSSPQKRWIHISQCASIPKYPLQTTTKTAAYEMELGLKLCSSAP